MAIYREDYTDIDLVSGSIRRDFLNHCIGEGDVGGDRFGMRILRGGAPASLSGCSVTGYFIRADGNTILMNGYIRESLAFVGLPASCYTVPGNFTLAIKITGGGLTGTMRIVDGTVVNTTTDTVVDPGHVIPDLDELLALIGQAEDAAEDIARFSVTEELIEVDDYRLIITVTTE